MRGYIGHRILPFGRFALLGTPALVLLLGVTPERGGAQAPLPSEPPPVGREAVEALVHPPLLFDPPRADEYEILGIPVFHLYDPILPLVDFQLVIRGGSGHLPRSDFAPSTALPFQLRPGGTSRLHPDSLNLRLDLLALQVDIGSSGGGTQVGLNALSAAFPEGLDLLREILLEPGFDPEALEVWRGQEVEWIRRREDDPGSLAFAEFNRLMFGDHPVGWVMEEEELAPDRLSVEALRRIHQTLFCRDRLLLGVSGDLPWEEAEALIERFLAPWPACTVPIEEPPPPDLRRGGGVFILPKEVPQSTVILAQPGGILQGDTPDFFASRLADHILGGAGFSSRIMTKIRTEEGLAYGAASLWTTGIRHEGVVGAFTQTRADRTVAAARLLLEILAAFRETAPDQEEIEDSLDELSGGYVFAFQSAAQIVGRRLSYRAQRLPEDWLERYLEGLQEVTPEAILEVVRAHIHPEEMTILIVGDPRQFDLGLEGLGELWELAPNGDIRPWGGAPPGGG